MPYYKSISLSRDFSDEFQMESCPDNPRVDTPDTPDTPDTITVEAVQCTKAMVRYLPRCRLSKLLAKLIDRRYLSQEILILVQSHGYNVDVYHK